MQKTFLIPLFLLLFFAACQKKEVTPAYQCKAVVYSGGSNCSSGYHQVAANICCPDASPYYCPAMTLNSNNGGCYTKCENADYNCKHPLNGGAGQQSTVSSYAATGGGGGGGGGGAYTGQYSTDVYTLLGRAGSGSCPSTPPTVNINSSCQYDMYVKAAVLYAWAANCEAEAGNMSVAATDAQQAHAQLQQASSLCSNGVPMGGGSCYTTSIYNCHF